MYSNELKIYSIEKNSTNKFLSWSISAYVIMSLECSLSIICIFKCLITDNTLNWGGDRGGAFQKLEIFSVIFKIFQSSYWTKLLICCCKLYWKVSVCLNIYQSYSWNWIATNKLFLVQWLQFNFNRKTDMYSNELKVDITLLL